jgi:RHS repeat-associated protein
MTKSAAPKRALAGLAAAGLVSTMLVLGMATPASAALPTAPTELGVTGARPSATELQFGISDQVSATVDVATGNLRVSNSSIALRGVTSDVAIGQTYNLLGAANATTSSARANRWTLGLDGAGFLSQGAGTVVYTDADGATWSFTPVAGSTTAFTSPAGFKRDQVATAGGYALTDRTSRQVISFNTDGRPVSVADRNGNTTTIGYTGANPTSIVSTAGPVAARTATLAYNAATYTLTVSQTSGTLSRSVKYVKDADSNLTSIVDAEGKTTSFTYTGATLRTITAPSGSVTSFSYISGGANGGKLEKIAQTNTTAGSPGTSTTRLAYASATQTLVAGPNTDQAQAVTAVPRTTYTFDATSKLVTAATDAMGRNRAATYTPNADVASATSGTGATAGTSTAEYGANNGESATKATAPGGASKSAAYANTAAATKYLPSSTTDDSGNASTYTYNGAGNMLTSTDATAATATLTYNTDGTVATALAPGNGTNKTVYTYNANKQLSTVTPVTGAGLGIRTFTYDDFGRTKTATNGRGITVTYGYDKQDRLTSTSFSDSTPAVTNTYTDAGSIKTRTDANGTTTYGYDQLGRLTSRVNTFGGGTIAYGYDKASNLVTTTDSRGTTTNTFDASGVPTQVGYTKNGTAQILGFTTDDQGRRTDSYLQTNAARTVWAAHTHTDYDTTGRVSRTVAQTGPATAPTTTFDTSYCYNSATPAPTCGTGTATDRSKLQWSKNNITGEVTTYSYNAAGHITQVAAAGSPGVAATTWAYTYDARGNRLSATSTGGSPSTQTFTVNAANQITTTGYTFDGAGNMTADTAGSYAYTGADQMKTVTQGSTVFDYKYAGTSQNEVLEQEKTGTTYQLTYGRENPQGNPVVEQVKAGADTAYIENDPVTGQPLMIRTSSGTVALYVTAGPGNPVGLITDAGSQAFAYKFDPYGVPILTANSGGLGTAQNPFLFAGGIQDRATGWVHFGARWYNPTTGRWTQQDTLDNPLDPANANRYAYAGNDPVNNVDPSGRDAITAAAGDLANLTAAGAALGGVGGCILTAAAGCLGGAGTGAIGGAVVGAAFGIGYVTGKAIAGEYN